ncbi:MAG: ABC transporter substrate-binding protein [Candidatus Hodarchaeales archaeon]|jgi:ABC-type transport system substrate-binding protein
MDKKDGCSVLLMVLLCLISLLPVTLLSTKTTLENWRDPISDKEPIYDCTAGYVDELVFSIQSDLQAIDELQAGLIDMIGIKLGRVHREPILDYISKQEIPEIEITETPRNGFGHYTFNCGKAPTNFTELRVAFARALDKITVQTEVWGNSIPLDSPLPTTMGNWSLENQEWWTDNYWHPYPSSGNQILNAHGWKDIDGDGRREDPNGNPVEVVMIPGYSSFLDYAEEAFDSIGINTTRENVLTLEELDNRINTGDFNLVRFAYDIDSPLFLNIFQSSNIDNYCRWSNETYDDLIDNMTESIDPVTIQQACWDAQVILWHEQPIVPYYQNTIYCAHRIDPFTGWVNQKGKGIRTTWNFKKVRLKEGFYWGLLEKPSAREDFDTWQQGGRFTTSWKEIYSYNAFNPFKYYSFKVKILDLIYDKLFQKSPNRFFIDPFTDNQTAFCMGVAKDWVTEEITDTTADPRALTGDRQKITFYLHDGYNFSDGESLTTEDVKFSYELLRANNFSQINDPITHVEVVNDTVIEFYFNTSGLFNMLYIDNRILPKHVWENVDDPLNWTNDQPIGSGPYKLKSYNPGVEVVLERNDDHFYNPRNYRFYALEEEETTTSTTTTSSTETGTTTPPPTSGFEFVTLIMVVTILTLAAKRWKKYT